MSDPVAQRLDAAVARLRARFGDELLGVALFGSRARGDAREDSDLDLFVVARGLPTWEAGRDVDLGELPAGPPIALVLRTPEEFLGDVRPLDLDLALDARVLHERAGFLSGSLARLRAILAEAGLERGPDLFWRWRTPPARRDWAITWDGVRK